MLKAIEMISAAPESDDLIYNNFPCCNKYHHPVWSDIYDVLINPSGVSAQHTD